MSQVKTKQRKSIPVALEKAQEKVDSLEIRPKMQLNVGEDVVANLKTRQQLEAEQALEEERVQTELTKEEFKRRCYYYGGVLLGGAICWATFHYMFKSNPVPEQLVAEVINGTR